MCYIVETGPIAPEVIPTPISVSGPRVMYRAVKLGSLLDALGGVLQRGMADGRLSRRGPDRPVRQRQLDGHRRLRRPKGEVAGQRRRQRFGLPCQKDCDHYPARKASLPPYCDYITSPGYIDGPDGRKRVGLPQPYPDIFVITDLTVMSINKGQGRLRVDKLMPGVSLEAGAGKHRLRPLSCPLR